MSCVAAINKKLAWRHSAFVSDITTLSLFESNLRRETKNESCGNYVRPSVCSLLMAAKTVSPILMQFGTRVLYKNLSGEREVRGNRLSDGFALVKGVNQFVPPFPNFLDSMGETWQLWVSWNSNRRKPNFFT